MNKLFIWIPKTAGTSIFNALQPMKLFLENNFREFDNTGSVTFGHLQVGLLIEMKVISEEYWKAAYKFAVVRNPYDRFISLYEDFLQTSRIRPDCTPIQFAKALLSCERKPGIYNAFGFSQCAAQHHWLKLGVDVLRFEDMGNIESKLGGIDLHHLNSGYHKPWQEYYDPELYTIVTDLYYDDLLILGYEVRAN